MIVADFADLRVVGRAWPLSAWPVNLGREHPDRPDLKVRTRPSCIAVTEHTLAVIAHLIPLDEGEVRMRRVALVAIAVMLAACATDYQASGLTGGFSETQLDRNVFRVTFEGNGYTRADRASDFALLRSAELTLKSGFKYFVVVDGSDRSNYSTITTPMHANTTSSASVYGNTAYGSSRTTFTGGQNILITAPSSSNTIVCFLERPQVNGMVYDAQFVFDSLSKKYKVNGKQ